MPLRRAIIMLCALGLYVSLFMLHKTRMAERGELEGPSVVKEPHARLFFGIPNALLGSVYFPFIACVVWIGQGSPLLVRLVVIACVAASAATSFFLAYTLLFVTKRECPYCWAAHAINATLLVLVPILLVA